MPKFAEDKASQVLFNYANLQEQHYDRQWTLINWLALTLTGTLLLYFILNILLGSSRDCSGLLIGLFSTAVAFAMKVPGNWLAARTRTAILLSLLFLVCVYLLIFFGGLHTGIACLLLAILVAGTLNLGRNAAFYGAGMMSITIASIQLALAYGILPEPRSPTPAIQLIEFCVSAVMIAILLQESLRHYQVSYERNQALATALMESEHRQKIILDNIPDFILRINRQGQIVDLRRPTSRQKETERNFIKEHSIKGIATMFGIEAAQKLQQALDFSHETGYSENLVLRTVFDSQPLHYECRIIQIEANESILVLRDITQKKREEIMRDALHAASDILLQELDPDSLSKQIVQIMNRFFQFQWNAIGIFDHASANELRIAAYMVEGETAQPGLLPASIRNLMTDIATTGYYEIESHLSQSIDLSDRKPAEFPPDLETYLAVPIRSGKLILGVIWIGDIHSRLDAHFIIDTAIMIGNNIGQYLVHLRNEREIARSLKEKEILLQEVHHRVKNNLQLITSLLDLQLSDGRDRSPEEILGQSARRIRSIALVHEKLYQTKSMDFIYVRDYVKNLTDELTMLYSGKGRVRVDMQIDEIKLDLYIAIPLGIIINELITNSFKYAFGKGNRPIRLPRINIIIRHENQNLLMSIQDNGHGFEKEFRKEHDSGLGLKLVDLLVGQISGTWRLPSDIQAHFEFRIPYAGPRKPRMTKI